ncbi:hypothetical protein VKS41_004991 [Umbelopsis sp. WA50703]
MASHSPIASQSAVSPNPRSSAKSKASDDARLKRLKVGRACFTCRQKKIKCDGVQPCMQCKARRRPCTFSKDGPPPDVADEASENMDMHEQYTTASDDQYYEHDGSPSEPYSPPRPSREKKRIQKKENADDFLFSHGGKSVEGKVQQAEAAVRRTKEILHSLSTGTMEIPSRNQELHSFKLTSESSVFGAQGAPHIWEPEPPLPRSYNGPLAMPSKATQELLIQTYFEKRHNVFPVMPRRMFMQQISVKGYLITPLLLNAMYAHAAMYLNEEDPEACEPATVYFNRAKLLIDDFLDTPRVSTVIALCLLSLFEFKDPTQARFCRSWVYSHSAFRLCHDLGMCRAYTIGDRMKTNDIELRKRVFWGCYCLDKLQSIDTNGTWMIRSEEFDIDMPSFQPADFATEHETLEGFVAYIKLMQIAERVMHFESYQVKQTLVRTREHEQMLLSFNNDLLNWLRSLPPHLQWTPLPTQANATAPHPPANSIVSHVHLVYNAIELSVLKPYANSTNKLIQHRCHAVAENITQLATFLCDHQDFIATYRFLASALMRASVVHVNGLGDTNIKSASRCKSLLQTSLKHLLELVQHRAVPALDDFAMALQTLHFNGQSPKSTGHEQDINRSPQPRLVHHQQALDVEDERAGRPMSYNGSTLRPGQKRSYSDRQASPSEHREPVPANHLVLSDDEQRAAEVLSYTFSSQSSQIPASSAQRQSSLRYTSANQHANNDYALNLVMGDHWPTSTASAPPSITQHAPATFSHSMSPQSNGEPSNQPPSFNLYNMPKSSREHNQLVDLVSDPSNGQSVNHAPVESNENVNNRWNNTHPPNTFDNRHDSLLYSIAAAASNNVWTEQENDKWLSTQDMFERSPSQRPEEQSRMQTPQQQYMNIGLGVYASAHQHHTDVIRQHFMMNNDRNNSVRPVILTHQGNVVVANDTTISGLGRARTPS